MEHSFREEQKRRLELTAEEIDSQTDEYETAFAVECHSEDIFEVEIDFPRLQRYALFFSMMGMVEGNVVGLCRVARRIFPITCEFNERAPGVVTRGVKNMEQYSEINTIGFRYYINLATNLNGVRNCITQAEGVVSERLKTQQDKSRVIGQPDR